MNCRLSLIAASRRAFITQSKTPMRFGHGHHGPSVPPFARLAPPTSQVYLRLEIR
jgi:hypothetical protein